MTGDRAKGTYTLLIGLDEDTEIEVGALGVREFPVGWYAYTGSALGSGGFARVDRHRRVARGDYDTCFWHIDYLLRRSATTLESAVRSAGVDAECEVARSLPGRSIPGFGASDCDCDAHLTYTAGRAELASAIERAHSKGRDVG